MMISRCRLCGRKLTTPKSIQRGVGPVCYKKLVGELWEQSGQTIYTKNAGETLKAIKTAERYDIIIQEEEDPEPTGAGHAREEKAIWKITREMR